MRIVCLTSNDYINCLVPFAHYWNRFAGADRGVTVVCYERLPEGLPENFEVLSIGTQADYAWSSGLKHLLFQPLSAEAHILLLLEDYWLTHPVNWQAVEYAWNSIEDGQEIAKIDLSDDRMKVEHRVKNAFGGGSRVIQSANNAPFQASLQAAIWSTQYLFDLLADGETAWEFEKNGTRRWHEGRCNGYLGGLIYGFENAPMVYANAVGGAGHKPGVIEPKHMPGWMWQECIEKGWAHG